MANEVRLIDANALKESLKKYKVKGYNHKYVQGMQDAIDGYFPRIIDDAPTIEAEPDNGWISVKDRLPDGDGYFYEGGLEESKYVLVYGCYEDHYGYGIGTYIRDHIDHDAGWSGCLSGVYELDCCNVTHWQHLPEPPKGE